MQLPLFVELWADDRYLLKVALFCLLDPWLSHSFRQPFKLVCQHMAGRDVTFPFVNSSGMLTQGHGCDGLCWGKHLSTAIWDSCCP